MLPSTSATTQEADEDHAVTCIDPSPVEYKLSKISTTSAAEAAVRKTKQAAALEGLKKRKEQKEMELKNANQDAVQRLLKGLSQAKDEPKESS